jgi:hypothetical protein
MRREHGNHAIADCRSPIADLIGRLAIADCINDCGLPISLSIGDWTDPGRFS